MTTFDFSRRTSWLILGGVVAVGIVITAYFGMGYTDSIWGRDTPTETAPATE